MEIALHDHKNLSVLFFFKNSEMCDWGAINFPQNNPKWDMELDFFAWAQVDPRLAFAVRADRLHDFCEILLEVHAKNPNLVPRLDIGLCPTDMNMFNVELRSGVSKPGFRSLADIGSFTTTPNKLVGAITSLQDAKLWRLNN